MTAGGTIVKRYPIVVVCLLLLVMLPASGLCAGLKDLPDGALVRLRDRVVSAAFADCFYIEEPDRSSAMRVDGMSVYYVSRGDVVEISGVLTTQSGERTILVNSDVPTHFVTTLDSGYALPRPLGMNNKAIGGGNAGPYTPGVGLSAGLNNTGLLVTVWGTTTTNVSYGQYGDSIYYLDDGSGLPGEWNNIGVRVSDDFTRWPGIGEYLCVTGVVACEVPPGATATVARIRAVDYTPSAPGTGTGTLTGTVTAGASAANRTVRIYGTGGSTTCTLGVNGSGSYTLPGISAGDHTFSAELPGFTRDTTKVTITANQTATRHFTLSGAQAQFIVTADPGAIPACSGQSSTVTAIAYYDSGVACGNADLTFRTDRGQFVSHVHTQETHVTTDARGKATVQLWQGGDSAGIARVTVSSASPVASASIDVPMACPIPPNVFATGVGSGKIAVYWDTCPGAPGYEVYRGVVEGGSKSVVTGTAVPAFEGSSKTLFVDQVSADDTTYYYAVRAVYNCGVSDMSGEDSAVANSAAIPWDTRNPTSIGNAVFARSPESVTCPVDIIAPDGTVYTYGLSPVLPAVAGPPGPEPADASLALSGGTETEPSNAHYGPYRKVESYPGYRKETAGVSLPTVTNTNISPVHYPDSAQRIERGHYVPCSSSGDTPFMYLGSLGQRNEPVDAGLRYEASDGKWNLFLRFGNRIYWVFDPNMPAGANPQGYPTPSTGHPWIEFARGSQVLLEYWCAKDRDALGKQMKSGVWLRATGTTGQRAVFAEANGHPQNGAGVSMKRVSQIAQYLPVNFPKAARSQYAVGFQKSGSYLLEAEWTGVQIYDATRAWWVDATHARFKQEFPGNNVDENLITYFMETPYYSEKHIDIDLR